MPKIQVFLKHAVIDEIKGLVDEDIAAGANPADTSISSKTCMLVELGLRVYNLRRSESVGNGRDDFDKLMLQTVLESKFLSQQVIKTMGESGSFDVKAVKEMVKTLVDKRVEKFFPVVEEGE